MSLPEPMCSRRNCIHFQGISDDGEENQRPICLAFPEGIPDDIAYGDNLHLTPVTGDGGVVYQAPDHIEKRE